MKYDLLGEASVKISAIGMGCWAFAGGAYWGTQEEKDSIDTINAAMHAGINFFDTAEMYGDGKSEEVVGKALQHCRSQVVIATKAASSNLSHEKLIKACEQSLKRLKTDYIDLYQIHWPNREVPFEETAKALELLVQQGKVRTVGVCNFGALDMESILKATSIVSNQLPYSLLWRAIEGEILPQCINKDVGILCYSPLSQGLLTGKYKSVEEVPAGIAGTRYYSKERSANARHGESGLETETFYAIDKIRKICERLGKPMGNIAVAWLLAQKGIKSVLVGARTPKQLHENIKAGSIILGDDVIKALSDATLELKQKVGNNPDMWEGKQKSRFQ